MRPRKNSPYGLLPPIRSGVVVLCIIPLRARFAASTPLIYNRMIEPSHVRATWLHALTASAVGVAK